MNDHEKLWSGVYSGYERTVYDVLEREERGRL